MGCDACFGTEADVEGYLWSLANLATFCSGIGVITAALTRNFLTSSAVFAGNS